MNQHKWSNAQRSVLSFFLLVCTARQRFTEEPRSALWLRYLFNNVS